MKNNDEYLILVDEHDNELGMQEKHAVHKLGLLHRAFSVFIFNTAGELILQQRADEKYHSAGLWTNTCCSHPHFGEDVADAVNRRLNEEMGLHCETKFVFNFTYKVKFENGLTEHEYDHVYFGITNDKPVPDTSEVKKFKLVNIKDLMKDVCANPGNYTEWFKICLPRVISYYDKSFTKNYSSSFVTAG